jgi:hypothetical protein
MHESRFEIIHKQDNDRKETGRQFGDAVGQLERFSNPHHRSQETLKAVEPEPELELEIAEPEEAGQDELDNEAPPDDDDGEEFL